ncbi:DUF261 family protein [Borrelia sp. P9F1]|uniref:DUF261 family protein n=1 Tax=Borrelia sp. P9F1 TaxID=3058374 RepID=UPI002648ABEB|nr:DUF261 family protein [Borrelia sp. P9F1]WKC58482.1 DUF261 family protein [Borrelia sp. P9F1]
MVKKARIPTILQNNPELHKSIRELGGYYLSLLFYVNRHIRTIDFNIDEINRYYLYFKNIGYLNKNSIPKFPCKILEYFGFSLVSCRHERVTAAAGEHNFTIFEVYIDSLDTVHHIAKRGRTTLYDSRDLLKQGIKCRNTAQLIFSYYKVLANTQSVI